MKINICAKNKEKKNTITDVVIRHIKLPCLYNFSGNITAVFTYKLVGEQLARIVDEEQINLIVSIAPGKYGKPPNINR